ncbi:alpha/beta hydrolase domain-containing protein [Nocardiopsis sp. CNT312]|uniref:alpha/beta hydrolase domain-containing protein n=1 Tax=Nocardiopsis sp. CNT312 TaxID=1137268 RepID=UPI00048CBB51|nr:alpha/beta hydrolase domain-containing protein [Nocardiopsis sp. CNT312]
METPTAPDTGANAAAGPSVFFRVLFGPYEPYPDPERAERYGSHGSYVSQVVTSERTDIRGGYISLVDSLHDRIEAIRPDVAEWRRRPTP